MRLLSNTTSDCPSSSDRPSRGFLIPVTVCLAMLAAIPLSAQDEPKDGDEPKTPTSAEQSKLLLREVLTLQRDLSRVFESGELDDDSEDLTKLQRMLSIHLETWKLESNLSGIPKLRQRLVAVMRKLGAASASDQAHNRANAYLLQELPKMFRDSELHIATRFNAMLQMAELNQKELSTLGKGVAVPLPAVYPLLTNSFSSTEKELPDAVRVAALYGLTLHARPELPQRNELQALMLATLNDKQVPATRSPEAHVWVRRRAIGILAGLRSMGTPGNGTAIVDRFVSLVNDKENESIQLRCDAARALGQFNFALAGNVELVGITTALGQLAMEVVESDAGQQQKKSRLHCVRTGLMGPNVEEPAGIAVAAVGDDKQLVDGLLGQLTQFEKVFSDSSKKYDEDFEKAVDEFKSWFLKNAVDSKTATAG